MSTKNATMAVKSGMKFDHVIFKNGTVLIHTKKYLYGIGKCFDGYKFGGFRYEKSKAKGQNKMGSNPFIYFKWFKNSKKNDIISTIIAGIGQIIIFSFVMVSIILGMIIFL